MADGKLTDAERRREFDRIHKQMQNHVLVVLFIFVPLGIGWLLSFIIHSAAWWEITLFLLVVLQIGLALLAPAVTAWLTELRLRNK